ncbi:NADH-quinone oxidoreductase subunit D [Thermanaerothrix sp. 4228-RoL]|uniref:Multifunctional fusion protein n=2 Tax=Thermanaerothrix TaxID=1077886 RepID=A0ABU3NK28_9CHLR|nr:NADH-quinone oxidoreductase subunit D [Thermanaerothrix sp. 4228-RoL]MDT8897208.1 NADH-quinone oxidoreductase subunit D [Thermanaerothrix sp. 4228-RoL]
MSEIIPKIAQIPDLSALFPDKVHQDTRLGYQGYIVEREHLLEVVRLLRDEYGYDYLSSVTGVDYLPEGKMEVVYHLYKTLGGPALVLKVQTPREDARVPSLVPLYRGAEFQEREAWDLLGIRFEGHPDLRRILMWEGFAGFPLRKDWREPYFEEEAKPYKSRWPEGFVFRAEDRNPFGDNVQYPPGFDPESWTPEDDEAIYRALKRVEDQDDLHAETLVVNLGPQHPSTHGVFRMVVSLVEETILDLKPVMGYLHRNHEKIGERNTFLQNMPFTDRLDYICSMSNNFGYALAVEKLMGIKPPERAEYIRVMMAELTRFLNHIFAIGFLLNDLGAYFTPALYAIEERELILDIFEAVSGSRMMCNYFRFGGVARDVSDDILEKVRRLVNDRLPRKVDEMDEFLTKNEIVRERCEGVGILTAEQAIANSASGPVLRASGVPYDVRRADPYSIYDRLEFDVAVRYHGDIYDRYLIRLDEMRQSLRILQQVLRDIPEGPIMSGKPQYQVRVPPGEAYGRVEGPKGELGFYVVSNGKPNPWRYHVRAPSFINLTSLVDMARGNKVADVVAILGSIDIVLGEVDR